MAYWIKDGDVTRLYGADEQWVKSNGDQMPGDWPKSAEDGWQQVVLPPEPVTPGWRTIGNRIELVDGIPTRVWLTEPVPPPTPEEIAAAVLAEARGALIESDGVAMRCLKAGAAYPAAWLNRDALLRAIVKGDHPGPIPPRPNYPEGT